MRFKRSKADKEVCSVSELIDKIDDNEIIHRRSKNNAKIGVNDKKYLALKVATCVAAASFLIYSAIGYIKYNGKFLPNTIINGTDFSGMTVEEVCDYYENKINNYELDIYNDGYIIDKYKPNNFDLALSYKAKWNIASMIKKQCNLMWLPAILGEKDIYNLNYMDIMTYNVHKLNFKIADSVGYNLPVTINSRQGSIYYTGSDFVIVPPVASDKIEPATYIQKIYSSIQNLEPKMVIEEADCYVKNDMTPEIENKLKNACITAKKFFDGINMNIKLENSDANFNNEIINSIYNVDGDYNFICNEKTIDAGIDAIRDRYNTVGNEIKFHTSHGTDVNVVGGDYGTYINIKSLRKAVKSAVLDKKVVDQTITYKKNTLNGIDGIGDTYVEIDLTNQYLYMYSDGKLVLDCPIVSGLPGSRATPQGVYRLKNKAKYVTLVGPNYRTPVTYWMPFNGGIGMHDAVWQSYFGGNKYLTKGSHGCINMAMKDVGIAYKYAKINMPVICYYHERISAFKPISAYERNKG